MKTGKLQVDGLLTNERLDIIENNIMTLAFYRSIDNSKSIFNLDNGFIDQFEDETGIDNTLSLNKSYDSTNDLYSPASQGVTSDTKLLFHNDFHDGSEGIPDDSGQGHIFPGITGGALDNLIKKFGRTSLNFNGSGDYIKTSPSDDFDLGTANFTIDFWVYRSGNINDYAGVFSTSSITTNGWVVYFGNAGTGTQNYCKIASATGGWSDKLVSDTILPNTTWTHIAIVRNGNTMKMYQAGVEVDSADVTGLDFAYGVGDPVIGRIWTNTSSNYLNGKLDELRISKGIARWTTGFTPETSPYITDSYTKLLLHMDTVDESPSAHQVLFYGNSRTTYNNSISAGCAVFDGTGDYLSIPDSDDWAYGTSDFTIEFYAQFPDDIATGTMHFQGANYDNRVQIWKHNTGNLAFYSKIGATVVAYYETTKLLLNDRAWHHFAFVRNGSNFYIFMDGVSLSLTTLTAISTNSLGNLSAPLIIGRDNVGASSYIYGAVDEYRISNTARYTTGFTPPTTPFTSDSNTKLLLHFEDFTDSGDTGHTVTPNGNVHIESYKFGTGALQFDGASRLAISNGTNPTDFDIVGSAIEDWTVDFWVKHATYAGTQNYFRQFEDGSNYYQFIHVAGSGLKFLVYSGGSPIIDTGYGGEITDNEWHHICFVRLNTTHAVYVDGVQTHYNVDTSVDTFTASFVIGSTDGLTSGFNGSMDEFRINKTNYFGAVPNVGKTDTITVPTAEYSEGNANMTLVSEAKVADSGTEYARIVIYEEDIDAVTVNTDLTAKISLDDGVTWADALLEDDGTYEGNKRILTSDPIDMTISGLGSGTDILYKLETANNKDLKIHGVGVNWL